MSSWHVESITPADVRLIRKVAKARDKHERTHPHTVLAVLYYLARWARGPSDLVQETIDQIAEHVDVSPRVVKRALSILEEAGLVVTLTRGGSEAKRGSFRRLQYAADRRPVDNSELGPPSGPSSEPNSGHQSANSGHQSANSGHQVAHSALVSALYPLAGSAADPSEEPNPYGWTGEEFQQHMTRHPRIAEINAAGYGVTADELLQRIIDWESMPHP